MRRFLLHTAVLGLIVLAPQAAFAAAGTFKEFTLQLINLIDLGTLALFSAAIMFFLLDCRDEFVGIRRRKR